MSRRLTMQEKIDRFVARITTKQIEKAYLARNGQCIGCMTTTTGVMFDDACQNYGHLTVRMQHKSLTWGVLKPAYRHQVLCEHTLCIDAYRNLDTVQEY